MIESFDALAARTTIFLAQNPTGPRGADFGKASPIGLLIIVVLLIVILALGHILVPLMIEVNAAFAIPLGWQAAIWPTLAVILATAMIQPVKGAVVALQWSRRMAGFA